MAMDRTQLISGARSLSQGNLGVPLALLTMLAMMTLPVPTFLLDVFFTFNIALSIVVLLVCVYAMRPLDFAAFPTILLVATLLRLALNVAWCATFDTHAQATEMDTTGAGMAFLCALYSLARRPM